MSLTNYSGLLFLLVISNVIALILVVVGYIAAPRTTFIEKMSAYECGFEPFADARRSFDIHFYVVAILFIVFDLEIAFLLPWCVNAASSGQTGLYVSMFFVFILILGFVYEWQAGALEWTSAY